MGCSTPQKRHGFFFMAAILLLIIIGCLRISATYKVFWQVWDEPIHIAAGMEWLENGQYTREVLHPPFARVMTALGPYLCGIRGVEKIHEIEADPNNFPWVEGNLILHHGDAYEYNLSLARMGILPFFILATLIVALWAHSIAGWQASLLASLLFTTLPSILAHSGVATLDMSCAALVATAIFALTIYLKKPNLPHSIILGVSLGLAVITKFSAILFIMSAGMMIIISYFLFSHLKPWTESVNKIKFRRYINIKTSLTIIMVIFITIWAGYRFSTGPLVSPENKPYDTLDEIVGTQGTLHDNAYRILDNIPVPAPEFFKALFIDMPSRVRHGHLQSLLGEHKQHGWWYFYPVVFFFKTPFPFLVFSIIGGLFVFRKVPRTQDLFFNAAPAIGALGLLLAGMTSTINNGTRQLLCILPFLAVLAGLGAAKLFRLEKPIKNLGLGLVIILLGWQLLSSYMAHPDYLAYFNVFAGSRPEKIVVDGDLDWGQDLKRLHHTLRKRGIQEFSIKYFGSALRGPDMLSKFGFENYKELLPYTEERGWIAISVAHLELGSHKPPYDQYAWLKKYQPVERVGSSIFLYYIPQR